MGGWYSGSCSEPLHLGQPYSVLSTYPSDTYHTDLSQNMLWVEQPVGVGFSQGVPNITNEVELGLEFIGFYKQFVDAFGLQGWDVYLTGESYAGYYVPYIADAVSRHSSMI